MRRVAERLTGRQAFAFERNWSDMRACGIDRLVTTVVDVALWDLLGRTRREAVCEILGRRRTGIKAYWSTPFNHGPPEEYARCAVQCREDGYGGHKIHPCRDPDEETCRRDMDIYAEVRTAVGPHYPLMCDNFYSYDYDTALIVGRQLRNLHYAWYESPFEESPATLPDHIRLHRELKGLKLCGPERWRHSHEERLEWIRSEACDIGRTDIFYGGFTPLLQVVSTCEQAGKPCELHIGLRPHFQVFGATDETLIEYVEDYGDGFEIDKDGLVDIPMEPGFGFDVESGSAGEVVRKLNGTTKQPAERN
jgi:L-alanine-DL-glutamate epimerase-like enolase superfamily enzyme